MPCDYKVEILGHVTVTASAANIYILSTHYDVLLPLLLAGFKLD